MCDRLKMGRRVENVDNVEKMQKIEKKSKKAVDIFINLYYTYVRNRDEAWLSLVERCVRDAEVASSNLVASTYLNTKACWSSGQDDALSRRKPGFDSRTGHEAVWNFHTASFFISIIVFINTRKPQRWQPLGFLRRMRKVHHIS